MTNKVKAQGLVPDRKNCWEFFIKLIRKNLHVVLAFSPVGDDFRNRAKKFPALVNCTVIGEQKQPTSICPDRGMPTQRVSSVYYVYKYPVTRDRSITRSLQAWLSAKLSTSQRRCLNQ